MWLKYRQVQICRTVFVSTELSLRGNSQSAEPSIQVSKYRPGKKTVNPHGRHHFLFVLAIEELPPPSFFLSPQEREKKKAQM